MQTRILILLASVLFFQTIVWAQEKEDKFFLYSHITVLKTSDANGVVKTIKYDKDGWFHEIKTSILFKMIRNESFKIMIDDLEEHSPAIADIEGVILNGKKESVWRKSIGNIVLREETYHDNVLHGISRVFSFKGKLLFQAFFENGTGFYVDYYTHDIEQIFVKGNLIKGKRNGLWLTYFKSGQIRFEENYKDDLLQGKKTTYFESGQIEFEEHYKDNLLHGTYTSYDKEGNVLYTTQFINGSGLYKSYDLKYQRVIEEGQLENGYRIGEWVKKYYDFIYIDKNVEERVYKSRKIYTKDSPENIHLTHKLIEIVYYNGNIIYIYAGKSESPTKE